MKMKISWKLHKISSSPFVSSLNILFPLPFLMKPAKQTSDHLKSQQL